MKNIADKIYKLILNIHSFIPCRLNSNKAFPPLNVQFELTHRCNLNCYMCFQKNKSYAEKELTKEEIINIINELPFYAIITFTGGEPFVRKDFPEILTHTLNKRKITNILTNASLLNDEIIKTMVEKRLSLIGISLDGIEEVHDSIRRKPGLYERVINNIEKITKLKEFKKSKYPLIDIKTTILKENVNQLSTLYQKAVELKVDYFTLSLPKLSNIQFTDPYYDDINYIFSQRPDNAPELSDNEISELEKQINIIKDIYQKNKNVKLRFYPYNMFNIKAIKEYYENKLSPDKFNPCRIPWSFVIISPWGDVLPCLSYRTGNIKTQKLYKIWNGEKFQNFRRKLSKKFLNPCCLGCCYSEYKD